MKETSEDFLWRDEEVLRDLYIEKDLTAEEVGDELGCSWRTILNWTKRYNLRKQRDRDEEVYLVTDSDGYEILTDGKQILRHHQLLACLDHDPAKIFSGGQYQTHHMTGIPWFNVPGGVQTLSREEHSQLHKTGEFISVDGIPQLSTEA